MEPNPLITLVVLINIAMNKKGTQSAIANVAADVGYKNRHHPHWDNVRIIENKGIAVLTSAIGYCVLEERMYGFSQKGPLCTGVGFLIDSSENDSLLYKYLQEAKQ